MADRPLIDYAYDVLKKSSCSIAFRDLFENSLKESGDEFSDDRKLEMLSPFYTQLTIDSRFIVLEDNYWNLRERFKFDDTKKASTEDDSILSDNREEAKEEEDERRKAFGEEEDSSDSEEEASEQKEDSVEVDEPDL